MTRQCHSCGATPSDAKFPVNRPRSLKDRCVECIANAVGRQPHRAPINPTSVQTRASYRAAYRQRLKSAQGDLIDLIVPPP